MFCFAKNGAVPLSKANGSVLMFGLPTSVLMPYPENQRP